MRAGQVKRMPVAAPPRGQAGRWWHAMRKLRAGADRATNGRCGEGPPTNQATDLKPLQYVEHSSFLSLVVTSEMENSRQGNFDSIKLLRLHYVRIHDHALGTVDNPRGKRERRPR